jgi:hypothetical protein
MQSLERILKPIPTSPADSGDRSRAASCWHIKSGLQEQARSLYFSSTRFFPTPIPLLNIRFIRVW